MAKYRKKPVVVEAFKWTGDLNEEAYPEWCIAAMERQDVVIMYPGSPNAVMRIHTLEGVHDAQLGDFIIRGVRGELYPCKPDIFAATYESVDAEEPEAKPQWNTDVEALTHS
jgi:hypothetical protein